ncbi:uncharacterized protein AMSG_11058, partial [Thecamonas trahens ATCC 50062]
AAGAAPPKIMVMGALGRAGSGAVALCEAAGITGDDLLKWDMAETAGGGPFDAIVDVDVFVNCIYLSKPIPPFVTLDMIESAAAPRLSVVCDVSCDTTNPHNPIPFANVNTTFDAPMTHVGSEARGVDIVTIDNLPSLLPREASSEFSDAMLPFMVAWAAAAEAGAQLPPEWAASAGQYVKHRALADIATAGESAA